MTDEVRDKSLLLATMPDGGPEIFISVQGEGPRMGRLSLFVRLSTCNLYCEWCDTAYTWRWSDQHPHEDQKIYRRHEWQRKVTGPELVEMISGRGLTKVIFTGGEPLLHHRALLPVMQSLRERSASYEFEFETNGTIAPSAEFMKLTSLVVASPKLANSGMHASIRIVPALKELLAAPQTVLKFVVDTDVDFEEIEMIRHQFDVPADRIWIMPRARTADEVVHAGRAIIDRVIASGFNYSARIHLLLFGEKQGT